MMHRDIIGHLVATLDIENPQALYIRRIATGYTPARSRDTGRNSRVGL